MNSTEQIQRRGMNATRVSLCETRSTWWYWISSSVQQNVWNRIPPLKSACNVTADSSSRPSSRLSSHIYHIENLEMWSRKFAEIHKSLQNFPNLQTAKLQCKWNKITTDSELIPSWLQADSRMIWDWLKLCKLWEANWPLNPANFFLGRERSPFQR